MHLPSKFIKRFLMAVGLVSIIKTIQVAKNVRNGRTAVVSVLDLFPSVQAILLRREVERATRGSKPGEFDDEAARERTSEETQSPTSAPAWTFGH